MPRSARIDFPGARHHVMNRGARRANIFLDESCCSNFLSLLGRALERYGIRIHGFAIMPNHFHLMVESIQRNLGEAMKYVTSQYGFFLNRIRVLATLFCYSTLHPLQAGLLGPGEDFLPFFFIDPPGDLRVTESLVRGTVLVHQIGVGPRR
ncbi:MAG: hypothetical protein GY854_15075 [Deltaproteobacteria bacterium]|nr:hypothetical protein [Deltaproteobacteria bacterium]